MRKTKVIYKEIEVLDDIICNKCGKTLKRGLNYCGIEEVLMDCGYGSKYDGSCFSFSLCEDCTLELIETFKIPAQDIGLGWE